MPSRTRTVRDYFPGAITVVNVPFNCGLYPTIQQLARALMSAPESQPSTIMNGMVLTEESKFNIDDILCVP